MDFEFIKQRRNEYEKKLEFINGELKQREKEREERLKSIDTGSRFWAAEHKCLNERVNDVRVEKARVEGQKALLDRFEKFYQELSPQGKEVFDIVVFLRHYERTMDFLIDPSKLMSKRDG